MMASLTRSLSTTHTPTHTCRSAMKHETRKPWTTRHHHGGVGGRAPAQAAGLRARPVCGRRQGGRGSVSRFRGGSVECLCVVLPVWYVFLIFVFRLGAGLGWVRDCCRCCGPVVLLCGTAVSHCIVSMIACLLACLTSTAFVIYCCLPLSLLSFTPPSSFTASISGTHTHTPSPLPSPPLLSSNHRTNTTCRHKVNSMLLPVRKPVY
jgi:hypothetical protein